MSNRIEVSSLSVVLFMRRVESAIVPVRSEKLAADNAIVHPAQPFHYAARVQADFARALAHRLRAFGSEIAGVHKTRRMSRA